MKKKNVLTMAMSVALVGVIAVGGTMAYLTASDDAVVNTFKFVDGGEDGKVITVTLTETDPNLDETIGLGDATATANLKGGYDYENVVPGQQLPKAPKVTVNADVNSYVFVKITDGTNVTVGEITDGWTEYEDGVYYKEVTADKDKEQNLGTIFTSVTVEDMDSVYQADGETLVVLDDIKIQVAAVAKGSLTLAEAAEAAEGAYMDYQSEVQG